MSEFKRHRLADLYEISSGISTTKDQAGHGAPFVAFKDIYNNYFIPERLTELMDTTPEQQEKFSVREGDVFLTRTSETLDELAMSSVALQDHPNATFSGFAKRLRPRDPSNPDPQFMGFFLRIDYFRRIINSVTTMTTRASFNEAIFSHVEVDLPDLDSQVQIGELLYSIEQQIELNNQVNDNLQAMLQTLYGYWFLQFDFPDENGRPYRSSGGRMVWNDQLKREIPAGWRVGANEELFDGIRTGLNPRQNFSLRTQGIAYLTVKNLTKDGGLDFASCDYIDEEAMAKVRRRSDLRVGDILFASIAPLRRCFLIYEEPRDWEINESVFSIRPRRGVTTPEYVYCHLMSDAFVKQAEQSSTGSIFKGIRHETLKGLMTVIPPEIITQSYASAVSPIMRMRNDNLEENRKLQELRDWLLPMLMNGQATVASSDKLSFI